MTARNRKATLLMTTVLGMGALAGCEYCLVLLPAILAWVRVSSIREPQSRIQAA